MGSELCREDKQNIAVIIDAKNKAAVRKKQILIVMIQMETKSKIICTSQRDCFAGGRNCGESAQESTKRKNFFLPDTERPTIVFSCGNQH